MQAWGGGGGGGNVVACHNKLRDGFVECCRRANVSAQVEVGSGFNLGNATPDRQMFFVPNWSLGKPAAFDLTVTSQLHPVAECRKLVLNMSSNCGLE